MLSHALITVGGTVAFFGLPWLVALGLGALERHAKGRT